MKLSLVPAIMIICGIVIQRYIAITNVLSLAIGVVIYTIIFAMLMYVFGFNDNERNMVRVRLMRRTTNHDA